MDEAIAKYMPRIREICPDLDIQSVTHNGEGLSNAIFIVNGDTVFRFAKDAQGIGELFVSRLSTKYPETSHWMKRARFYAQAIELQWALSGITGGDTLWFLAHIGGARDIQP